MCGQVLPVDLMILEDSKDEGKDKEEKHGYSPLTPDHMRSPLSQSFYSCSAQCAVQTTGLTWLNSTWKIESS